MTSWGLIGGLEVLPALAVPCGFASAASFVCFVFYDSFIVNPLVSEGTCMLSSGLGWARGVAKLFVFVPFRNMMSFKCKENH